LGLLFEGRKRDEVLRNAGEGYRPDPVRIHVLRVPWKAGSQKGHGLHERQLLHCQEGDLPGQLSGQDQGHLGRRQVEEGCGRGSRQERGSVRDHGQQVLPASPGRTFGGLGYEVHLPQHGQTGDVPLQDVPGLPASHPRAVQSAHRYHHHGEARGEDDYLVIFPITRADFLRRAAILNSQEISRATA
jgi:hypothetical protein